MVAGSIEDSFEALSPITSGGTVAVGGRLPWLVPLATEQFATAQWSLENFGNS